MTAPLAADAHEYGLAGDGTADDRPALQELVDVLGDATAEDGRPCTVRVPAGRYRSTSTSVVVSCLSRVRTATPDGPGTTNGAASPRRPPTPHPAQP